MPSVSAHIDDHAGHSASGHFNIYWAQYSQDRVVSAFVQCNMDLVTLHGYSFPRWGVSDFDLVCIHEYTVMTISYNEHMQILSIPLWILHEVKWLYTCKDIYQIFHFIQVPAWYTYVHDCSSYFYSIHCIHMNHQIAPIHVILDAEQCCYDICGILFDSIDYIVPHSVVHEWAEGNKNMDFSRHFLSGVDMTPRQMNRVNLMHV